MIVKNWLPTLGSVLLTLAAVAAALVVSVHLWEYYMEEPWTRDGRVRAEEPESAEDDAPEEQGAEDAGGHASG